MDNILGQKGQPQQIRINLDECENIACECGGERFYTSMAAIKRIKGIQVGTSQDQIQVLPLLVCEKCGKTLDVNKLQTEPKKEPSIIV